MKRKTVGFCVIGLFLAAAIYLLGFYSRNELVNVEYDGIRFRTYTQEDYPEWMCLDGAAREDGAENLPAVVRIHVQVRHYLLREDRVEGTVFIKCEDRQVELEPQTLFDIEGRRYVLMAGLVSTGTGVVTQESGYLIIGNEGDLIFHCTETEKNYDTFYAKDEDSLARVLGEAVR